MRTGRSSESLDTTQTGTASMQSMDWASMGSKAKEYKRRMSVSVKTLTRHASRSLEEIPTAAPDEEFILLPSMQAYWRTYASWLACWPQVAEARNDMALFAKDWESLSGSASCFTVLHTSGLLLRDSATHSEDDCNGKYLRPGQCFMVSESKDKQGTKFLKLANGSGWVVDQFIDGPSDEDSLGAEDSHHPSNASQPDRRRTVTKVADVELGEWWYNICTTDFVEVRAVPSFSDEYRSGWIMCPKEVTVVGLRCNVAGHRFVQLKDGRGWLFERLSDEAIEALNRRQVASKEQMGSTQTHASAQSSTWASASSTGTPPTPVLRMPTSPTAKEQDGTLSITSSNSSTTRERIKKLIEVRKSETTPERPERASASSASGSPSPPREDKSPASVGSLARLTSIAGVNRGAKIPSSPSPPTVSTLDVCQTEVMRECSVEQMVVLCDEKHVAVPQGESEGSRGVDGSATSRSAFGLQVLPRNFRSTSSNSLQQEPERSRFSCFGLCGRTSPAVVP